jgi:hypothetical protein
MSNYALLNVLDHSQIVISLIIKLAKVRGSEFYAEDSFTKFLNHMLQQHFLPQVATNILEPNGCVMKATYFVSYQKLEIRLTKFKGNRTHLQRRVKKATSFETLRPTLSIFHSAQPLSHLTFNIKTKVAKIISVGLGACQESKFVVGYQKCYSQC